MKTTLDYIASSPLFFGISKSDILSLLDCIDVYKKHYNKNEIIYLENDEIYFIGIVLEGSVHMVKEDIDGNKTILLYMKSGELFGETFACRSIVSSRVSFISNDCTALFIPFHKIIYTCKTTCSFHHKLIENMINLISEKNIMLINKIEIISQKNIRSKILTYLHNESEKCNNSKFIIPLNRIELADYLSINRSALSRELKHMKDEGIINFDKNYFELFEKYN